MKAYGRLIQIIILCTSALAASAQSEEVRSVLLDSVSVKTHRRTVGLKHTADGALSWDLDALSKMPQILSNADPIRYAQYLPGIQTNNEYQSGIRVLGCDNEHNVISLAGVPVYNVAHLMGFFSTFNASHFSTMDLQSSANNGKFANRVGAELTMQPELKIPDSLSLETSVGLISSQMTFRTPLKESSSLTLSVRASYIDLLYSAWLKIDGFGLKYSFYDANVTYVKNFGSQHKLLVDAYSGLDRAILESGTSIITTRDKWGNYVGGLHWIFTPSKFLSSKTSLYTTSYSNAFSFALQDETLKLRSRISDVGLKHHIDWKKLSGGLELIYHNILPQSPEGSETTFTSYSRIPISHSLECSAYASYKQSLGRNFSLDASLRGSMYTVDGRRFFALDPSIELACHSDNLQASLNYSLRHQYLFQAGFTDMGLPVEFWFSADEYLKPQYAHGVVGKAEIPLFSKRYQISLSAYYKCLYNQLEYGGNIFDLALTDTHFHSHLLKGKGKNYGFSVMLTKCSGRLTGWLSYAYGRAQREFVINGRKGVFPASHNRPHEFNAVLTYSPTKRWDFGATFTYCSGTPYTEVKSVYLFNGNFISVFGDYNGARLDDYIRLDLSVGYKWNGRRANQGVNFSLYNALCRGNGLFRHARVSDRQVLYIRTVSFLRYMLPSLSYFFKF